MPGDSGERYYLILALLLVVVHFIFIAKYFQPAISTLDSHGYHIQAKQIAKTGKTYIVPESRIQYIGFTWNKDKNGRYFTLWSPGFPLLLAIVYKTIGPEAALLVNPIMVSLSLLALFLVCRAWIGPGWGLLAAALTAMIPFLNQYAHYGYSHVAVVFFLMWGLYFLSRWTETRLRKWVFFAGLFLGVIPSIRPAEVLFLAAAAVFVCLNPNREDRDDHSHWWFFIGAVLPFFIFCAYNEVTFGGPLRTGYSLIGLKITLAFTLGHFRQNALPFLQKLLAEGGGFVFALGLTGIICLLTRRETWKPGALMALLVVPTTLLYMAFHQVAGPQTLRYMIPTFPLYAIGTVWLLRLLTENRRGAAAVLSITILALTVLWGLPQSIQKMELLERRNKAVVDISNMLIENTEKGSVVVAPEPLCFQFDFLGRWRVISISVLRSKRPVEYSNLVGAALFDALETDVREWAGPRKVYWLMKEGSMTRIARLLPKGSTLTPVAKKRIPAINRFDKRREEDRHQRGSDEQSRRRGEYDMNVGPEYWLDLEFDDLFNGSRLVLYEWTTTRKIKHSSKERYFRFKY